MSETILDLEQLRGAVAPSVECDPTLPPVRSLKDFVLDLVTNGLCLLGNRFLCRGGGLLFVGPTGIGKSVLVMQLMVLFALGRMAFGIKPSAPLKFLMVQAENDDGDIAEMRDGIFAGMNLSDDERRRACENVKIVCESTKTGDDFIEFVAQLVQEHKPDVLVIDPLLASLGDSVNEQAVVSRFLRNGLNPILQASGCAAIIVHHTNKPVQGTEKAEWKAGDFAYLGSGSADLANWARAVVALRSIGEREVFQLVLGKRGRRAGIVGPDGSPIYEMHLRHSTTGGICWEQVPDSEMATSVKGSGPSEEECLENFYALIPCDKPIGQALLFHEAKKHKIGEKRARHQIDVLLERGQIFEWKTKRSGTNPAKSYARLPQPKQVDLPLA